jgi:4,5-dihydroxyphthalate decarboxylase
MADLKLNLIIGKHPKPTRFQPLFDGRVKPEGIELTASDLGIDELFWRIPTKDDIDVAELSLTGTIWGKQHGKSWVAIPVFPGWVFSCHTETLVNRDAGIEKPEDLKGKKVGVPEYPVTAIAWIRHAFETKYGVRRRDITWFEERANDYSHYRPLGYAPPKDVPVTTIPREKKLCDMLISGELDAVTRYFGRPENATSKHPGDRSHMSLVQLGDHPKVRWLYPDRKAAAIAYHKELGYQQPIHCVIVKGEIVDKNPWVPMSLYNAFAEAGRLATDANQVEAPSYRLSKDEQKAALGPSWQPYGFKAHREAMAQMLDLCWKDGYIDRGTPFTPEEYFHPSTHNT